MATEKLTINLEGDVAQKAAAMAQGLDGAKAAADRMASAVKSAGKAGDAISAKITGEGMSKKLGAAGGYKGGESFKNFFGDNAPKVSTSKSAPSPVSAKVPAPEDQPAADKPLVPSKAIDQKLFAGVLGGLNKGIDGIGAAISKRYGDGAGKFVKEALSDKLKEGTKNMVEDAPGKALGLLGGAAGMAMTAITGLAAAAANAATSFVKYALDLRETRETTQQQMVGVDSSTMDRAKQISGVTGQNTDEVARSLAKLQRKGFDLRGAGDLLQAQSDVKLMTGDAGAGDQLAEAIAGIGEKNSGGVDQIAQIFGKKSKGTAAFKENLAAIIGTNAKGDDLDAQIKAAIASGKVTTEQAQGAALNALSKQTGKDVGGLTKDFSETTIVGAKAALKNAGEDYTNQYSKGDDVTKGLVKAKELLQNAEGPSYNKDILKVATEQGGVKGITPDLFEPKGVSTSAPQEQGGIKGITPDLFEPKGVSTSAPQEQGGISGFFSSLLSGQQNAAAQPAQPSAMMPNKEELTAGFADASSWLSPAGGQIVDGLWTGITGAWGNMLSGFDALVAELPASVKQVLGIASPSKVFAQLGDYTMQGFEVGIDRGAEGVQQAVESAVAPPSVAQIQSPNFDVPSPGQSAGASGSSKASITINGMTIEVHSESADAAEVADEVYQTFLRALEQTAESVS